MSRCFKLKSMFRHVDHIHHVHTKKKSSSRRQCYSFDIALISSNRTYTFSPQLRFLVFCIDLTNIRYIDLTDNFARCGIQFEEDTSKFCSSQPDFRKWLLVLLGFNNRILVGLGLYFQLDPYQLGPYHERDHKGGGGPSIGIWQHKPDRCGLFRESSPYIQPVLPLHE